LVIHPSSLVGHILSLHSLVRLLFNYYLCWLFICGWVWYRRASCNSVCV